MVSKSTEKKNRGYLSRRSYKYIKSPQRRLILNFLEPNLSVVGLNNADLLIFQCVHKRLAARTNTTFGACSVNGNLEHEATGRFLGWTSHRRYWELINTTWSSTWREIGVVESKENLLACRLEVCKTDQDQNTKRER